MFQQIFTPWTYVSEYFELDAVRFTLFCYTGFLCVNVRYMHKLTNMNTLITT